MLFSSAEISVIRKIIVLSNAFPIEREADILQKEKGYFTLEFRNVRNKLSAELLLKEVKNSKEEFKKSFLRGIFLGCGILSAPPSYHIEMHLEKDIERKFVSKMLTKFHTKHSMKNDKIYITGRGNVERFLYLIGASSTFLILEEDAVEKALSNELNRKTNFEYANLKRQSDASTKQLRILNELKKNGKFDSLNEELKEVAFLRMKYPYASLSELSQFSGHLSKQAIYHRLRKIIKKYEE